MAGNALEFYDFTVYATFAEQIGHAFFPSKTAFVSQILTLLTFGVGFLLRPLGAWVIGRYGDRAGRRPAMMLSFSLMCAGVLGMALTPSYAQLGLAAPLLVVLFRLVQGFALGGEVGPTTAFLIEACPPSQRGYYGAWQYASQGIAILAAGSVGLALIAIMPPAALTECGWRIPFLLGAAILPLGFYLRHGLPETLTQRDHAATSSTAQATDYRRTAKLGVAMLCSTTVCFAIFNYMTTYATQVLHMAQGPAFGATIAAGLANLIFNLAGGAASDRWGRKSLMLYPLSPCSSSPSPASPGSSKPDPPPSSSLSPPPSPPWPPSATAPASSASPKPSPAAPEPEPSPFSTPSPSPPSTAPPNSSSPGSSTKPATQCAPPTTCPPPPSPASSPSPYSATSPRPALGLNRLGIGARKSRAPPLDPAGDKSLVPLLSN